MPLEPVPLHALEPVITCLTRLHLMMSDSDNSGVSMQSVFTLGYCIVVGSVIYPASMDLPQEPRNSSYKLKPTLIHPTEFLIHPTEFL